ncbi:MAG: hypothetical protein LBO74_16715 [Candidatus Symbiothrix sp.]|jgi:hypothetical protein|nr:hypothetical protein [Candidatus Symbiothrix sp.]
MATITLNYDARNSFAKTMINAILLSDAFTVDKSKPKKNVSDKRLETLRGFFPIKENYSEAEFLAFNSMYNMAEIIEREV